MLTDNKMVAIIGGGPGGLTLANLLQKKGVAVKVFERDVTRAARVQGATLDLHYESGLKALRAAGLLDAFRENFRPGADGWCVVDKRGKVVAEERGSGIGVVDPANSIFDDEHFRPEIDRDALRNLLLDALEPGTVVWDSQFKMMLRGDGGGWMLEFANGTTVFADLVIGADGANSRIRPFVTDTKLLYAGIVIVQGNVPDGARAVPEIDGMLNGGKIYGYGDGKYLHASSKGDGSIDFYMSSQKEEIWVRDNAIDFSDRASVEKWFASELAGWDAVWLTLVERASLPLFVRPQYYLPLDKGWDASRDLTLLGDAAHIMPPSGEGVNLAMLDALELSEYLTSGDYADLRSAIGVYEQLMRERAGKELIDSMDMMEWMHAEGAQERFLAFFGR